MIWLISALGQTDRLRLDGAKQHWYTVGSKVPSSSGLGCHPLKVKTRVRVPLGLCLYRLLEKPLLKRFFIFSIGRKFIGKDRA